MFEVRVSVCVSVLYEKTLPLWRSTKLTVASGDELALTARLTTASPGTTGPTLIFTNRAVTGVGALGAVAVVGRFPAAVVSPDGGVPCPAVGKFVLVVGLGAVVMPAVPWKK